MRERALRVLRVNDGNEEKDRETRHKLEFYLDMEDWNRRQGGEPIVTRVSEHDSGSAADSQSRRRYTHRPPSDRIAHYVSWHREHPSPPPRGSGLLRFVVLHPGHRLISRNTTQLLLTKGDNNNADDVMLYNGMEWIERKHIIGKVRG